MALLFRPFPRAYESKMPLCRQVSLIADARVAPVELMPSSGWPSLAAEVSLDDKAADARVDCR